MDDADGRPARRREVAVRRGGYQADGIRVRFDGRAHLLKERPRRDREHDRGLGEAVGLGRCRRRLRGAGRRLRLHFERG